MPAETAQPSLPYATLLKDFTDLRAFNLKFLLGMEEAEALRQPAGFRNTLHWNLGHLLYTQGEALWTWCGLKSPFPGFAPYFGLGTSPVDHDSLAPDWDILLGLAKRHLASLPGEVAARLNQPLNRRWKFMNLSMATAGETLPFLIAHEGEHVAHIKRLRKALRPARD
jgi:hypothetical protein